MYGLINKAIWGFVVQNHGDEVWDRIRSKADVPDEAFIAMERYPDDLTYRLVGAACETLNLTAEEVLESFGVYWVGFADESYGEFLRSAGSTFSEFIGNLDQMHARVKLSFPELDPPSFKITDESPGRMRLHYYSSREGLAPLAVGVLRGVANRFNVEIQIKHFVDESTDPPHVVFDLEYAES